MRESEYICHKLSCERMATVVITVSARNIIQTYLLYTIFLYPAIGD